MPGRTPSDSATSHPHPPPPVAALLDEPPLPRPALPPLMPPDAAPPTPVLPRPPPPAVPGPPVPPRPTTPAAPPVLTPPATAPCSRRPHPPCSRRPRPPRSRHRPPPSAHATGASSAHATGAPSAHATGAPCAARARATPGSSRPAAAGRELEGAAVERRAAGAGDLIEVMIGRARRDAGIDAGAGRRQVQVGRARVFRVSDGVAGARRRVGAGVASASTLREAMLEPLLQKVEWATVAIGVFRVSSSMARGCSRGSCCRCLPFRGVGPSTRSRR